MQVTAIELNRHKLHPSSVWVHVDTGEEVTVNCIHNDVISFNSEDLTFDGDVLHYELTVEDFLDVFICVRYADKDTLEFVDTPLYTGSKKYSVSIPC